MVNKLTTLFNTRAMDVLSFFIKFPGRNFYGRQIARELKISHPTVLKYLKELEKLGFIKKDYATLYPTYRAETDSRNYVFYKRMYIVNKIKECGLIDYLYDKTLASSIILYGSCAEGRFNENSDIDIFVEASEIKLDLDKFEDILFKEIHVIFEPDINNLKGLKESILNGIILEGYVSVNFPEKKR